MIQFKPPAAYKPTPAPADPHLGVPIRVVPAYTPDGPVLVDIVSGRTIEGVAEFTVMHHPEELLRIDAQFVVKPGDIIG